MHCSVVAEKEEEEAISPGFSPPYPLRRDIAASCLDQDGRTENGFFFNPLPGFHFGACGPLRLHAPLRTKLSFDVPVISAFLFLEGSCGYRLRDGNGTHLSLQRNMFIAGRWQGLKMETIYPAQEEYCQVGFMVEEAALEEYFGRGMSADVREGLRRATLGPLGNMNTVAGIARPEALVTARRLLDMGREGEVDMLRRRSLVLDLFAKLFHHIAAIEASPPVPLSEPEKERVAALKSSIERDFSSIESAAKVCMKTGMSFSKANKAFKSLYFVTVAQYIQQCKMAHAYALLSGGRFNVGECAFAVGYGNISHFIAVFRKHFGMNPKAVSRQ